MLSRPSKTTSAWPGVGLDPGIQAKNVLGRVEAIEPSASPFLNIFGVALGSVGGNETVGRGAEPREGRVAAASKRQFDKGNYINAPALITVVRVFD